MNNFNDYICPSDCEESNSVDLSSFQFINLKKKITPVDVQQEYFDNLSDNNWTRYERSDRKYLLQNIAFAMFGSPSVEGEMNSNNNDLQGYTSKQKEATFNVFATICKQSKYSLKDEIIMSVLLIVCVTPRQLPWGKPEPKDHWYNLHKRNDVDIRCTPVFRIRICIPSRNNQRACKIFIDEEGRVYKSWRNYLDNNKLPKCILVVPTDGEYQEYLVDGDIVLDLTKIPNPASSVDKSILTAADHANTAVSVTSMAVVGASLFTPVAPLVLGAAAVATISTGVYGIVRSSLDLYDRSKHQQSINVTSDEARGSWLNIAASTVGIASSAATLALTRSAAAGTNLTRSGQILTKSVTVLKSANVITGGIGWADGMYRIINKYANNREPPSSLEVFQFAASSLFQFNAVISNRTAKTIIEEAQANTINNYRTKLRSNRHRKIFDKVKVLAGSKRVEGLIQGSTEVIRGIKNISNKDQFFADILKINKQSNKNNIKISLTGDGRVNLNAQVMFEPSELTITTPNVPLMSNSVQSTSTLVKDTAAMGNVIKYLTAEEVIKIGTLFIRISTLGAEQLAEMLSSLSERAHSIIMTLAFNIINKLLPEHIRQLHKLNPDVDVVTYVAQFVFNYMSIMVGEPNVSEESFLNVVKEFFHQGRVREETILRLKDQLLDRMNFEIRAITEMYPDKIAFTCNQCDGITYSL